MSRLTIGAIKLTTVSGPIVIAGWHDGTFGVDWRACVHDLDGSPGGYVVSHLASGYALVAVVANIEDVETFVAQLHGAADWSFQTLEQAREAIETHRDRVKEVFDTLPHHNPTCFLMAPGGHGGMTFGHS